MNPQLFLKLLASLGCVTERNPQTGMPISQQAFELKHSLELVMNDPQNARQIHELLAQVICNDWGTVEQVAGFVAWCLTGGYASQIPGAMQRFLQIAGKYATLTEPQQQPHAYSPQQQLVGR